MIRLAVLLLCLLAGAARAHETTRSYLSVDRNGPTVSADLRLAFRDIEVVVWMDEDLDGALTWAEVTRRIPAVAAYAQSALALEAGGTCTLAPGAAGTSTSGGIGYLDLSLTATCPSATAPLTVASRLFAEVDPDHRMYLTAMGAETATVLDRTSPPARIDTAAGGLWPLAQEYFAAGVEHLLTGPDHIVFLMMLILPAVTLAATLGPALTQVLWAVTGFTLAHALTLTAASTLYLRPPTDLIGALVALSILITAADNVRPFLPGPRAASAAFFGLIHGYGFATVLTGTGLTGVPFVTALAAFNLGIEAAQVMAVAATVFALHALRGGRWLLSGGSLAGAAAGCWWLWQAATTLLR
ncbi:MAG: HupE/UreJ family protein [Gemmobacter sp.]